MPLTANQLPLAEARISVPRSGFELMRGKRDIREGAHSPCFRRECTRSLRNVVSAFLARLVSLTCIFFVFQPAANTETGSGERTPQGELAEVVGAGGEGSAGEEEVLLRIVSRQDTLRTHH